MYRRPLSRINLDMRPGETPNDLVARMQSELGAVFNAVWHGYAARHPTGGKGGKGRAAVDPQRHDASTCRAFLEAWRGAGFDAYAMNDEHRLGVDWADIRRRFLRRGQATSQDRRTQRHRAPGQGSHSGAWGSWRDARGSGGDWPGWQSSRGSGSGSWTSGWGGYRGGEGKRGGDSEPGTPGKRGKWDRDR